MKKIHIVTIGLLIGFSAFIMCGKNDEPQPPPNHPPVANAGRDTSITLASCSSTGFVMLDGTASSDPENYFTLLYSWSILSAPAHSHANSANIKTAFPAFSNLSPGRYDIELIVADQGGLTAKDTVTVNVISSTAKEYDFDITITSPFQFTNNYEDCYYSYWYYPCSFYDLTYMDNVGGTFLPIGSFRFHCYEQADTAATSSVHTTTFGLYTISDDLWVTGTSSVNFKRVFQNGGGPFNGTFAPDNGSALGCDPNMFKSLSPLTVAGTMDTTRKTVNLNIKGKVYF